MPDAIADRLAIQDVMTRYATGVDTRDLDLLASCFAADVVASGFAAAGPVVGRDAWLAFVAKALGRFGRTQHLIGNQVVDLRGDEATMTCYVQATHELAPDRTQLMTLWGAYEDEFRRMDGHWRIVAHRLESIVTETRPTAAQGPTT